MIELYLEDLQIGQVFPGTTRKRVTVDEIIRFAGEFDPQPFHLDDAAAKDSIFGGLAASGWHTAVITMRLLVDSECRVAGGLIGLGFEELKWPRPVRPGDELRVQSVGAGEAGVEVPAAARACENALLDVQSTRRDGAGVGRDPDCAQASQLIACKPGICDLDSCTVGARPAGECAAIKPFPVRGR